MGKNEEVGRLLAELITRAGYESLGEFHRQTKCAASFETVRRAIGGHYTTWTLFLVLHSLNLAHAKIKEVLRDSGDILLHKYLSEGELNPEERAILSYMEKIENVNPDIYGKLLLTLRVYAQAAGANVTEEIKTLSQPRAVGEVRHGQG